MNDGDSGMNDRLLLEARNNAAGALEPGATADGAKQGGGDFVAAAWAQSPAVAINGIVQSMGAILATCSKMPPTLRR